MDKATLMEKYNNCNWLNKKEGFTRSTMTRKEYSKQQKAFSEAGLKRSNFRCSIKHYESERDYRMARAQISREWRATAFQRPIEPRDQPAQQSLDGKLSQQMNVQVVT